MVTTTSRSTTGRLLRRLCGGRAPVALSFGSLSGDSAVLMVKPFGKWVVVPGRLLPGNGRQAQALRFPPGSTGRFDTRGRRPGAGMCCVAAARTPGVASVAFNNQRAGTACSGLAVSSASSARAVSTQVWRGRVGLDVLTVPWWRCSIVGRTPGS